MQAPVGEGNFLRKCPLFGVSLRIGVASPHPAPHVPSTQNACYATDYRSQQGVGRSHVSQRPTGVANDYEKAARLGKRDAMSGMMPTWTRSRSCRVSVPSAAVAIGETPTNGLVDARARSSRGPLGRRPRDAIIATMIIR